MALSWTHGVWLATFIAQGVIRVPHASRNKSNKITKQNLFTVDKITLALMFLFMMFGPVCYVATLIFRDTFFLGDYEVPLMGQIVGAALSLPGLYLFHRSHADLGRNWSPKLEVREGHTLVTSGIYKHMRHPMYTAIWLLVISQVLLLPNYVCSLPVLGAFIAMCLTRIPEEEEMMRQEFGTQYDKYCRTTARLIPNVL